jgi:nucleotide-binding universal stress UspA family protein
LVDVVSTGEDAIRLAERQRPDLIVMGHRTRVTWMASRRRGKSETALGSAAYSSQFGPARKRVFELPR